MIRAFRVENGDGEFPAIRGDGDGAVSIRPINLRLDHFEPPEDIRVGETEDVFRQGMQTKRIAMAFI